MTPFLVMQCQLTKSPSCFGTITFRADDLAYEIRKKIYKITINLIPTLILLSCQYYTGSCWTVRKF